MHYILVVFHEKDVDPEQLVNNYWCDDSCDEDKWQMIEIQKKIEDMYTTFEKILYGDQETIDVHKDELEFFGYEFDDPYRCEFISIYNGDDDEKKEYVVDNLLGNGDFDEDDFQSEFLKPHVDSLTDYFCVQGTESILDLDDEFVDNIPVGFMYKGRALVRWFESPSKEFKHDWLKVIELCKKSEKPMYVSWVDCHD